MVRLSGLNTHRTVHAFEHSSPGPYHDETTTSPLILVSARDGTQYPRDANHPRDECSHGEIYRSLDIFDAQVVVMHTYNNLKATMKGQAPSTWSPALRPKDSKQSQASERFGTGLPTIERASDVSDPPPVNQTIYQSYEWYTPSWSTSITVPQTTTIHDTIESSATTITTTNHTSIPLGLPSHYSVIKSLLPSLGSLGITSMWLPPGCKATNSRDNGYGVYDLYDLGEFDTHGSRATKWGSKEELVQLGLKAEEVGIGLLWDAVLNHRAAADDKEQVKAVVMNPKDRTVEKSTPKDITAWCKFTYPARQNAHSTTKYTWRHFSGIDWDDASHTKAIYKFLGDDQTPKGGWATDVDTELGNYDYLMFADLDYNNDEVRSDVLHWSTWLPGQIPGLKGYRLDAIKHYSARFQYQFLKHLRENSVTKDWFVVGEYWRADSRFLAKHIDAFDGHMHLFDVKLVHNFTDFANGISKDLRKVFAGSLVELKPSHAVTFVTNHDTQATQSLTSPVAAWFQPHAYALILLRKAGIPCIFHGDVFGTLGPQPTTPAMGHRLMRLSLLRTLYAYGAQHEFFDIEPEVVAWSREGHVTRSAGAGMAVVLNVGWGWKGVRVFVGRGHAGEVWTDAMGWSWDEVVVDAKGWGLFRVGPRSIGVWTWKEAEGRDRVDECVWPPLEEEI